MKRIALALLLAAHVATAHAEVWDGNDLYAAIQSSEPIQNVMAPGYLAGVHDTGLGVTHCPPPRTPLSQIRDVVRVVLVERPAIRSQTADVIIAVSLRTTWPCKRAPARPGVAL